MIIPPKTIPVEFSNQTACLKVYYRASTTLRATRHPETDIATFKESFNQVETVLKVRTRNRGRVTTLIITPTSEGVSQLKGMNYNPPFRPVLAMGRGKGPVIIKPAHVGTVK